MPPDYVDDLPGFGDPSALQVAMNAVADLLDDAAAADAAIANLFWDLGGGIVRALPLTGPMPPVAFWSTVGALAALEHWAFLQLLSSLYAGIAKGLRWLVNDPPRKIYKNYPRPIDRDRIFDARTDRSQLEARCIETSLMNLSDTYCALAALELWQGAKLANDKKWMLEHERTWSYFFEKLQNSLPEMLKTRGELLIRTQKEVINKGIDVGGVDKEYRERGFEKNFLSIFISGFDTLTSVTSNGFSESWYIEFAKNETLKNAISPPAPLTKLMNTDPRFPELTPHILKIKEFRP